VHLVGAGLVGRAEADLRLAGDQEGGRTSAGRLDRRGYGLGIMAVDSEASFQPDAARSARSGRSSRHRDGAVDGDVVVVPQDDQLVQLQVAGEAIASWLMPSIRQPSPAIT
jgi:hypothetical protein